MAVVTIQQDVNKPAIFESATTGKAGAILGKLQAPFFDLGKATRNGRYYGEAAEAALDSEEFKEKMATRTLFGRLGHPMTEDEMREDPAVRACVVLTDYRKNPETNTIDGTLEILNNQYGRQLKSLIDAGCVMGVSTRGSGDSFESMDGNEVITKGTYDFEALDVVTLPAVKEARVRVIESVEKNKRKKLEQLVEESTNPSMLEALKVTIESSEMPNKKQLLESIDKKLNGDAGTTESLANDIMELTTKLTDANKRVEDAEAKVKELESKIKMMQESESTGTTEIEDDANKSDESLKELLKESAKCIEDLKTEIRDLNEIHETNLTESRSKIDSLTKKVTKLESQNAILKSDNDGFVIANARLLESKKNLESKLTRLESIEKSNVKLTESKNKIDGTIRSLNESVVAKTNKIKMLEGKVVRLQAETAAWRDKSINLFAEAYGISAETLRLKVNKDSTIQLIEAAAKSIRDAMDAKVIALPDVLSLGKKVAVESVVSNDPDIDRAVRISTLLN